MTSRPIGGFGARWTSRWSRSWLGRGHAPWLIALLLVAFLPRVCWVAHTAVIENEGALYASLADNLRSGRGYVAVFGSGTFFNYPPLYPLLIAAVSALTGDVEWAGRLVSVLAGTLVVLPIYLATSTLYGPRVARIAAALFALHPLLIGYSAAVYAETTYVSFVALGLCCALRAQALEGYASSALAGVAFGLAYLTRVEAVLLPVVTVPLLLLPNWRRPRRAAMACGVLLASFAVVASPYVAFLWAQTGSVRVEAKGPVFFLLLERMASGLSYLEAAYGLDRSLVEGGPYLRSWREMLETTAYGASDVLGYLAAIWRPRLAAIFAALAARPTGSWPLLLLAFLGLLRSGWDRARLAREALLLAFFGCAISGLLMTRWVPTRYLLSPLAILLVWAAKGIEELSDWVRGTLAAVLPGALAASIGGRGTRALLLAVLLAVALGGTRWEPELLQGLGYPPERAAKEAGLWLRRARPGSKVIMDVSSVFSFYAGGTHVYLPYCEADTALRYLASKSPEFVVLSSQTSGLRPYLQAWLATGIPDGRATRIHSEAWDGGEIAVYEWRPRPR